MKDILRHIDYSLAIIDRHRTKMTAPEMQMQRTLTALRKQLLEQLEKEGATDI